MPITAGSLADGQLPTTVGALYTVPASTTAIIKSFVIFNTNAATQTVNVYITRSGSTRRQLHQFSVLQNASVVVLANGETWALSTGDTIDGDTTTGTAVDYVITGATDA